MAPTPPIEEETGVSIHVGKKVITIMNAVALAAMARFAAAERGLILLAPAHEEAPAMLRQVHEDAGRYYRLLGDMQRFRGRIYLEDGALRSSDLRSDGRHSTDADLRSWHVIAMDENGEVCGCSRYRIYPRSTHFSELAVSRSALAQDQVWRTDLVTAVERERDLAWKRRTHFVEVGGWAISAELRRTTAAIRIALATYALAAYLGGCIGITTATLRHHSASVLRKIGGSSLYLGETEIPRYFDPGYECYMEILKFESVAPHPRFIPWIEQLSSQMADAEVITNKLAAHPTPFESAASEITGIPVLASPFCPAWQLL